MAGPTTSDVRRQLREQAHTCATIPFDGHPVGTSVPSPFTASADVRCYAVQAVATAAGAPSSERMTPVPDTDSAFCLPGASPLVSWYGFAAPGAESARFRVVLGGIGERLQPPGGLLCPFTATSSNSDVATLEVQVRSCGNSCALSVADAPLGGLSAGRIRNGTVASDILCSGGGTLTDGHRCFSPECISPYTLVLGRNASATSFACANGTIVGATFGCADCTPCEAAEAEAQQCAAGQDRVCTVAPTAAPSSAPTPTPSVVPTAIPTDAPTLHPTARPSHAPTVRPTTSPTLSPRCNGVPDSALCHNVDCVNSPFASLCPARCTQYCTAAPTAAPTSVRDSYSVHCARWL